MPKSAYYTLTWSPTHQVYELYEGQGDDALDLIPDSLAWLVWVCQVSSFAFHGQHGSCTVRKERKRRGGEYWYAYARVEGNLSKRYLGRDSDLTLRRLEQVAQAFWLDGQAVAPQKQAGASAQARPASPTRLGESVVLGYLSGAQARSSDGSPTTASSSGTVSVLPPNSCISSDETATFVVRTASSVSRAQPDRGASASYSNARICQPYRTAIVMGRTP